MSIKIPDFIFGKIPDRMRPGIMRYIMNGINPGDFLTSVFSNDFYEASHRADGENRLYFKEYAIMLGMLPMECWGSKEAVTNWVREGGLIGRRKGTNATDADHQT